MSKEDMVTFYEKCVEAFHDLAKSKKLLKKGIIQIPELAEMGVDTILTYLKEPSLQSSCNDAIHYYKTLLVMALKTGIIYSAYWHTDFQYLQLELYYDVMGYGPSDYMGKILENDLGITNEKLIRFAVDVIFEKWLKLMKPYWDLQEARNYVFYSFLAIYQLGISIELSHLGY